MASETLPPWDQIGAVAVGGAVGSVLRFITGYAVAGWLGTEFPWATLFVNLFGSLWLGWVGGIAIARPTAIDPVLRLLLTTGFAGGLTTFSTFSFETLALFQRGEAAMGWVNILANVVIGISCAWLGIIIARSQGAF
jgi:CrcB protein